MIQLSKHIFKFHGVEIKKKVKLRIKKKKQRDE